ncbi:MAG: hypothetical protein B0D92_06085 [Spirochaeta sp. LUC14_002_19_P3]|nr:MAG: hypothetical protein B0D92_06085 [Spirochaeta sp. LUC14_002_19_P3]
MHELIHKNLDILIIPSWYPTDMDPSEATFFREQAQALAARGHSVTVVFTRPYSLKAVVRMKKMRLGLTDKIVSGVREIISYIPKTHIPVFDEAVRFLCGKLLLKKWTKQVGKPNIVHIHVYQAGLLGKWYQNYYGVPMIVTEHFTGFKRNIVRGRELRKAKSVYMSSRHNIAVSLPFAELLKQKTGINFDVISNIVDTKMFYPAEKLPEESFIYLYVGNMIHTKSPEKLLLSFYNEYKIDNSLRLVMVGTGNLLDYLKRLANRLKISHAVEFPGYLERAEVASIMRKVNAFVLPSQFETFGIVVIEAMASGLPVISTRCGGPESIIIDGINGFLVEPDCRELQAAMNKTRKRDWDRNAIRNYAESNYSKDCIMEKIENLYTNTIAGFNE